jgi:hypothetical protein
VAEDGVIVETELGIQCQQVISAVITSGLISSIEQSQAIKVL